ncbi:MAG TPA: hypothetical protein VHE55_02535 [Fimbriimonadaceae bacterium]|nr:hypothetical protein [Fimbriimonadaceae bacterium]
MKIVTVFVIGLAFGVSFAQDCPQMKSCPMMQGDRHAQGVDKRGDKAMGFSHEKTQHHFRLFKDGGSIDIVVKDNKDRDQVTAIRSHLKMISGMFAKGDFHLPMFIHDRVVPGQKTMEALRKQIAYSYADLPNGGRVRIRTSNAKAIAAIHNFLRFQIGDHRAGDSGKVEGG